MVHPHGTPGTEHYDQQYQAEALEMDLPGLEAWLALLTSSVTLGKSLLPSAKLESRAYPIGLLQGLNEIAKATHSVNVCYYYCCNN